MSLSRIPSYKELFWISLVCNKIRPGYAKQWGGFIFLAYCYKSNFIPCASGSSFE